MASSLIGALRVSLGLDTAQFEAGAKKATSVARAQAAQMESAFKGVKTAVTGLFAALTVGLLAEQIKKSLDYAGSLAEVSKTLGVTTKDLQTFRFAASQSGVAQDQLEVGLRRLTVSMGKAELGSSAQAKAFGAIGISVEQLKGKNTGDVFRLMADGLSKVTDRSQRAAIEMTLMGRSGSTLDNLLAPGSKRLNELADAAQRLGIVLSDSQIQGAEETAHKLEAVKEVLAAQIAGVVADNAGAILSLASALGQLTGSIVRFLGSNPQLALGIVGALLGANIGKIGGSYGAALGALAGGVGGIALGGKLAQAQLDSTTDINVRKQQLRNALNNLQAARAGGSGDVRDQPGFGMSFGGPKDVRAAIAEVVRQTGLLNAARAQGNTAPPKPGIDLPKIFAGKEPKAKRPPKDLNEDVSFQFAQQERQADQEILQAKIALSHDVADQAQLQLEMLDLQQQARDAEIDHKVKKAQQDYNEGKITKATLDEVTAQEGILKQKEVTADKLKAKAILDDRDRALLQQQEAIDSHYLESKQGLLQKQADLAKTQSERRKIELDILEIAYQEKKKGLERLIEEEKIGKTLEQQAKDPILVNAQLDLANLPANHALDKKSVIQQTQTPLQAYFDSIPKNAQEIGQSLEQFAVKGLEDFNSQLADAIVNAKSLKDVFHSVANAILQDLIKIALQEAEMALFKAVLGGLGSIAGGSLGGGDLTSGGFASPTSLPGGDWGSVGAGLPGFATGGSINIGGRSGTDRNLLSLNGLPIAKVSYGERINIANDDTPAGGMGVSLTMHNDFRGVDASSVARIQAQLDSLKSELPGQIISTWSDANNRFAFRGKFK